MLRTILLHLRRSFPASQTILPPHKMESQETLDVIYDSFPSTTLTLEVHANPSLITT
jgi:hypothetical protein